MIRGEIWTLNLDPTVGAEIRKTRPVVIVSHDDIGILPLRVIVPVTDWKDRYSSVIWMVKLNASQETGLQKVSAADAFQVRSVSEERFVRRLGQVSNNDLESITEALSIVLGY
jgi:mRNA interferase MazF